MLAGKGVGVVTVGKQADFDIHALFKQHIDTADRGLDTCRITVIKHGHVVGEAVNHADLSRCKCRSRRSDNVLYAGLMHGNDIRVAFNKETAVLFHYRLLGTIDAV